MNSLNEWAFSLHLLVSKLTSGCSVTLFTMTFFNYLMMPNDPEYDSCDVPRYDLILLETVIYWVYM